MKQETISKAKAAQLFAENAVLFGRADGVPEQAGLAPIDRISWFVRNAYIAGYMMAVDTLNEATKAFIADFIGGGYRE